jgi:thiamine pyrophosphokinase
VIAVDSGLYVALAAGLTPTVLVGDLDSISPSGLEWAARGGVPIEAHPADKDATDTALALATAAALAASDPSPRLHVLCGSATDRLDHLLGLLAALGAPELGTFRSVRADIGTTQLHVLHAARQVVLTLARGRVFSLLSLHGTCAGVDVEAARWPLADATLTAHSTVGISNESTGADVTVRCASGVLTVAVPEVLS